MDKTIDILTMNWLTGPIFDKELRISSRRKRNYVIRSLYILLLMLVLVSSALPIILDTTNTSNAITVTKMAQAGLNMTQSLCWFQFIAAPLLITITLSSSFCDEIRRQTLYPVMSTPITSGHIVVGKLSSSMLQVVILMSISLSALSIIRVFGGIQWEMLVTAYCTTITCCILCGSLTIFFSQKAKRPYNAIIKTITALIIIFSSAALPGSPLAASLPYLSKFVFLINPFAVYISAMAQSFNITGNYPSLFSHCLSILLVSSLVTLLCTVRLRSIVLGVNDTAKKGLSFLKIKRKVKIDRDIKPVTGCPIIWKEFRKPYKKRLIITCIIIGLVFLVLTPAYYYYFFIMNRAAMSGSIIMPIYSFVTMSLYFIISVWTMAMAAGMITKEKEGRTWPILLCTPIEEKKILFSKARAVLWKNLAFWLIILVNSITLLLLQYSAFGNSQSFIFGWLINIILYSLKLLCTIILLIGVGLYFSARCKTTTTAVISSVIFVIVSMVLWRIFFRIFYGLIAMRMGGFPFIYYIPTVLSFAFDFTVGFICYHKSKKYLRRNIFAS